MYLSDIWIFSNDYCLISHLTTNSFDCFHKVLQKHPEDDFDNYENITFEREAECE